MLWLPAVIACARAAGATPTLADKVRLADARSSGAQLLSSPHGTAPRNAHLMGTIEEDPGTLVQESDVTSAFDTSAHTHTVRSPALPCCAHLTPPPLPNPQPQTLNP